MKKQNYKSILVSPDTKKLFDRIKVELQVSQDEALLQLLDVYSLQHLGKTGVDVVSREMIDSMKDKRNWEVGK